MRPEHKKEKGLLTFVTTVKLPLPAERQEEHITSEHREEKGFQTSPRPETRGAHQARAHERTGTSAICNTWEMSSLSIQFYLGPVHRDVTKGLIKRTEGGRGKIMTCCDMGTNMCPTNKYLYVTIVFPH